MSRDLDLVLDLPQSAICDSIGSRASLFGHMGLCFIMCNDHCILRSKWSTWDSWNLLKCKSVTSLCRFIFYSFSFSFYILQVLKIILIFKHGNQLDKSIKDADEEVCSGDTCTNVLCNKAGPGPASVAFPAHLTREWHPCSVLESVEVSP